MSDRLRTTLAIFGLLAAVVATAWGGDQYVRAQIETSQVPVAQILRDLVPQVKANTTHRVRAEERARLIREGYTPPKGDPK